MTKNTFLWGSLAACLIFAFYSAGQADGMRQEKQSQNQRQVDTLKQDVKIWQNRFLFIKDSTAKDNAKQEKNFLLIDEIKKAIRNEINKQNQKIYSLPDSAVQHYVDSIRANGGFK